MPIFEKSVTVNTPIEELFDFMIRPTKVMQINPPELKMNLLDVPEVLDGNSIMKVDLLGFGIPQRVIYEITEFNSPTRFTMAQTEGPVAKWIQSHDFTLVNPEVTILTERIDFDPPGGMLGFMLTADRIKDSLAKAYDHRHQELQKIFG
ncbi:MAG: hypothetical protein R3C11_05425 [Planctomycetaceae bacterium]